MSEDTMSSIRFRANLQLLMVILAAIGTLASASFSAGILFGPLKQLPDKFEGLKVDMAAARVTEKREVSDLIAGVSSKVDQFIELAKKNDLQIGFINTSIGRLQGQQDSSVEEDERQWDELRKLANTSGQALSRETFLEWKSRLEIKSGISVPPLSPQ